MVTLLAIESATEALSVGLQVGDQILIRHTLAPREHARLLLPTIASLLSEADIARSALDAIAVGRGPGAFTGVRIAIAAAQGLGLGLNRPLLPVSTLKILAQSQAALASQVLTAMDARMGEIYAAVWSVSAAGLVDLLGAELCINAADWQPKAGAATVGVGSGFAAYPGLFKELQRIPNALPHARDLLALAKRDWELGRALDAHLAQPVYLRNEVAVKTKDRVSMKTD